MGPEHGNKGLPVDLEWSTSSHDSETWQFQNRGCGAAAVTVLLCDKISKSLTIATESK